MFHWCLSEFICLVSDNYCMCKYTCVCPDVNLVEFSEAGVWNYSTLLLSEERHVLYVGAREAIYELSMKDVSVRKNKVRTRPHTHVQHKHLLGSLRDSSLISTQVVWKVPETHMEKCIAKGKSKEVCLEFLLESLSVFLYLCCHPRALEPVRHVALLTMTPAPLSLSRPQTECLNYIRVLQVLNKDSLYVCGTHAFQPQCDHLVCRP